MPAPLRLAIVGLGRIAGAHVAALERRDVGVELVAGVDPTPPRASRSAAATCRWCATSPACRRWTRPW